MQGGDSVSGLRVSVGPSRELNLYMQPGVMGLNKEVQGEAKWNSAFLLPSVIGVQWGVRCLPHLASVGKNKTV